MTRLPRTIRLDPSDKHIFASAAEPGEWAVPGTFLFWDRPADSLSRSVAGPGTFHQHTNQFTADLVGSGIPKLDLVIDLAGVLDWSVEDVVTLLWEQPEEDKKPPKKVRERVCACL